jgi:hexosaminidase
MIEKLNRYERLENEGAYLTEDTKIENRNELLCNIAKSAFSKIKKSRSFNELRFVQEVGEDIRNRLKEAFGNVYRDDPDGYVIEVDNSVSIYAVSLRGLIYGAHTLMQIGNDGFLKKGLIYNIPICPFRGLKLYLPAYENIDFFKQFIDMACYYRYNTIIIEVGGAMEYKLHTDINDGWVEYCRIFREYSGKASETQTAFNWEKNSIHCENGEGSWLTQDTVRDLVAYCRNRGLDVIPEVPCLSHCDYLLTRHNELAERKEDPYPDTYCPSNPASYDLLFNVLDEIVDVFEPKIVHIGHDECYSICLCEKCKDKDPAEIYAGDITKIYKYLVGKGIHTMIWGDKLLNAISKRGEFCGGAARAVRGKDGMFKQFIPPMYKAIDMVPDGLRIMNWYWLVRREFDEEFLSRGMFMVYGNFGGPDMPEWSRRIERGALGASLSNWSALHEDYLQRNGIFFNMAYCCRMFWKEGYHEGMYASLAEEVFADLFNYKNRKTLLGPHIEIIHHTTHKREYEFYIDGKFIETEKDHLGDYLLVFEDSATLTYPVRYGINISNPDWKWELRETDESDCFDYDKSLLEVSCTALPIREGAKTYYKIVLNNPFIGKKLVSIEFKPNKDLDTCVVIDKISVKL